MATVAKRNFKVLTAKKETLFSIIQNLYDLSVNLSVPNAKENFIVLYQSLNKTELELTRVVDEINAVGFECDEDFEPDFGVLSAVNELCCHIHLKYSTVKQENATSVDSVQSTQNRALSKLPKIEIPEFSGDIREWDTFYSVFRSLIHDNQGLSKIEKVHYLVGRLKGAALTVCAGIPLTENTYDVIWKSLLDKYQNDRYLANCYLDKIMEFKALPGESAKSLNSFLEKFDVAVNALKKIGILELADYMLLYQALSKLDKETVKAFEMLNRGVKIPTYDSLVQFIKEQAKMLHLNKSDVSGNYKMRPTKSFVVSQGREDNHKYKINNCIFCNKSGHYLGRCEKFKALEPTKRYETVRNKNWCYNCLSPNHGVKNCSTGRTCTECGRKHHILLHTGRLDSVSENRTNKTDPNLQLSENTQATQNVSANLCSVYGAGQNVKKSTTVLLSTAVVNVLNSSGNKGRARFLLDSGSQAHLMTVGACKRLGLRTSKVFSSLQGLGGNSQSVRGTTNLTMTSRHNHNKTFNIQALVVDRITDKLPRVGLDSKLFSEFNNLILADENFNIPGNIDGIIGADLFPFLLESGKLVGASGSPVAIQTVFGFVIMGNVPAAATEPVNLFVQTDELPIERLLNRFWEIEQVPKVELPNPDDLKCESLYVNSFSRDDKGRFCVALPFKNSPQNLGDSKLMAHKRLLSLEKRLSKSESLRLNYNNAMQDFIDQGHMRLVPRNEVEGLSYFIAHHPVFKESSSTPVRIVLDASSPCDNDVSLNDLLYSGKKLQTDIFTLLLNFRMFPIALTADIRQMYRQINIIKEHWRFQRLLWRFNPEEEIDVYEMTVVPFGLKASPFLALRTVKQLISDEMKTFGVASEYVDRDLYMDDLVCSVPSEGEAYELYCQAVGLFKLGGFDLTKWSTNSNTIRDKIVEGKRLSTPVSFKLDTKILGMQWNAALDVLNFKISIPDEKCTKRSILSAVARCYDPIGLIAPFILYVKLLVKKLWLLNLDWDDEPPADISNIWNRLRLEWEELSNFELYRHVSIYKGQPVMITAFADASQDGYGAVVYVRTVSSDDEVSVSLLCAKSKVCPVKYLSIPKLELCAALLLANLVNKIVSEYKKRIVITRILAFSDSSVVLNWLTSVQIKDIFVANRVGQIRDILPDAYWSHIEGTNNPADCLSRGLTPKQLVNHPLWKSGPNWLKLPEKDWPVNDIERDITKAVETLVVASNPETHPIFDLVERFSSWMKILRIMVWILRFLKVLPFKEYIQASDLNKAESILIRCVQKKHFAVDIKLIKSNQICSPKLRKLSPFMQDELLRVGGRLRNTELGFNKQHPIILPGKERLIELLVDFYHIINMHTGAALLEAILRQKYWILGSRSLIRSRIHKCNRCFRLKPASIEPLMADLPCSRVRQPVKVFFHTGVDYFGPFNITLGRNKGSKTCKAYVCLFICMAVKAVHLELVSSLSTAHFMQAFKRFLSRRGPCRVLYSDQGTNFVGAKTVLRDINEFINSTEYKMALQTELGLNGVEWKFNTPAAPHMGGLWEGNVRAAKNHIYRVLGEQLLTYEELATLLTQVEALLNSRPLCRLSADPDAVEALTPSHFLTIEPLKSIPADDLSDLKLNRLDRFQLIDRLVQDFWKRWKLEYLTSLQVKEKWNKEIPNIMVGTVVILKYDNTPPFRWPLAIITEVHPGKDGIIRNVTVKTSKGVFSRPVVKVCPLPSQ